MKFCPTLYMIRNYFTKSLQGYQFCYFRNIIFSIHEDDITYYNLSGRALLKERKIKLEMEKEDDQKTANIKGDWYNQGLCWEKIVHEIPMHARHVKEGTHQINILCRMSIFCPYIIWYKLTHSHTLWRHLWHVHTNVRKFVTVSYECQNTLWCVVIH